MEIYSWLKIKLKRINKTFLGKIFLFVPLIFYFYIKNFRLIFSNFFYSYFYYYSGRLYRNNDLTIGIKKLGIMKTRFPHPVGIVIGKYVKLGYGCTIYQNVTIGAKTELDSKKKLYPRIGNNVVIGANAIIIGDIIIGNNVFIGASTLVNKNIPDNSVVYGSPIRYKMNNHL